MKLRLRLRLGHKIFGSMLIVLCLTAAVGLVSLNAANTVGHRSESLASHWTPALFAVSDLHYLAYQHKSLLEQYFQQDDPEEHVRIEASMKLTKEAIQSRVADYTKLGLSAKEQDNLSHFQALLAEYSTEVSKAQAALRDVSATGGSVPLRSVRLKFLGLDQVIRNMKEDAAGRATAEAEGVVSSFRKSAQVIPSITAVALMLGLIAAFILTRSVTKPLHALAGAATQVAGGDLNVQPVLVRSSDEIEELATAFNGMVDSLAVLVRQVATTAKVMAGAAGHLSQHSERAAELTRSIATAAEASAAGASHQAGDIQNVIDTVSELDRAIEYVARGASEQAGSLNKIVAAVQDIANSLADISTAARYTLDASQRSETLVERTSTSMGATSDGMSRIRSSVVDFAQLIREMGHRSSEIDTILKVITDISDQTNLLALNAAIEAARAGQHGRGFAVVAEEIRALAERSRVSAHEIKRVVSWINQHTEQSIVAMEVSIRDVQDGVNLVDGAQRDLAQVQGAARETVDRSRTITRLTQEAAQRGHEMEGLINNVAAVAQENTAASEEMAASSHSVTQRMDPIGEITNRAAGTAHEVLSAGIEVAAVTRETAAAAQSVAVQASQLAELTARFKI